MMEAYLVLLSSLAFIAFLIPQRARYFCAAVGWVSIIASLLLDLPVYFGENNFMYPVMAVLGIPFLAITIPELMRKNPLMVSLSRAAAVAFLIYVPFAYIPALGDWLISVVVAQVMWLLSLIHYPVTQVDWNMISHGIFRVEVILACTGIQSIAIMLGVAFAVDTDLRQKILSFLLIAPTIYVLNLLRNVFVVVAYTGQWFQFLPEIASNGEVGYESFFWAHNVLCELGALVVLIVIAYALFMIIPRLGVFADGVINLYLEKIRSGFDKGKEFFGLQKD